MILGLNQEQERTYKMFIKSNNIGVHGNLRIDRDFTQNIKTLVTALNYIDNYKNSNSYERANLEQGYKKALEDIETFKKFIQAKNNEVEERLELEMKNKLEARKELEKYLKKSKLDEKLKEISEIIDNIHSLSEKAGTPILKREIKEFSRIIKIQDYRYDN